MWFALDEGADGWRWTLWTDDQRLVAESPDGYQTRTECESMIDLVRASREAPVHENLWMGGTFEEEVDAVLRKRG